MVWPVYQASGFGKYFLNGNYVGWKNAVRQYWDTNIPPEEKGRIEALAGGFSTYDFSLKFIKDFGPLAEQEMVHEFRTEKGIKEIAAFSMIRNQLFIVHQDLKNLIEALEPGLHQFWPMKISMPRGKTYPEPYFGLRIGQFLDSFRPDASDPSSIEHMKTYHRVVSDTKQRTRGLSLDAAAIGSAHLWRERHLSKPNVFISDELQAKAAAAGLQFPKHYPVKVV